jgi:hypothetical protein
MFDDFVEMAERGVQFLAGAFFEKLHERSPKRCSPFNKGA